MKKLLLITFCLSAISALAASTEVRFQTNAFNHAASGVGVRVDAGSTVGDTIAAATNNPAQTWDSELASYLATSETNAFATSLKAYSDAGTNAAVTMATNNAWAATQAATNGVYSAGTNAAWSALKSTSAMATNSATTAVDMTIPYAEVSTNNAFAWLPLSGVSETEYQTAVRFVTNSAAVAKAITAPANVHVQGTAYVTNVTACTFFNAAGRWTNLTIFPLF